MIDRCSTAHRYAGSTLRRLVVTGLVGVALGILNIAHADAGANPRADQGVDVYAAISLAAPLEEIAALFTARTGIVVRHSLASSAQLARQIEAGARADIFISADLAWVEYLQARGYLRRDPPALIAGNELVVVAPKRIGGTLDPQRTTDWQRVLGSGRWVTADPAAVPLGRYARESLLALGVWRDLEGRLASAENARAALALVARGEAAFGVIYASDALAEPRVTVLARLPPASHTPIAYPAVLTRTAGEPAVRYLKFLAGPEAARRLESHGFSKPPSASLRLPAP